MVFSGASLAPPRWANGIGCGQSRKAWSGTPRVSRIATNVDDMSDVRAIPLAGERFTSTETIEVRAPFDDTLTGTVPGAAAGDVDPAVPSARAALPAGPLPLWKRAEILDTAA